MFEQIEKRFYNAKNKTFECAWCNKKFNLLQELKQHLTASHSEVKFFF